MTLSLTAIQGRSTWWVWTIRDTNGALVEASTVQFLSAQTAEIHGRARLAEIEDRQRRDGGR